MNGLRFSWPNIAALLTGAAGLVASLTGVAGAAVNGFGLDVDPALVSQIIGGISGALLTVAGLLGDDDNDGIPNIVDATR